MSITPIISKKQNKNKYDYFDKEQNTTIKVNAFQIDVCDAFAQQRYRKRYSVDYKTAQILEKKIKNAVENGRYDLIENVTKQKPKTVGELFKLFKKEKSKNTDRVKTGLSGKTFQRYLTVINNFTKADSLIGQINVNWIEKHIAIRLNNGIKKETINSELRHLKALFRWGLHSGLVKENPFENIAFFRTKLKEPRILTEQEMANIEKVCKPLKWYPLFKLYMMTGARLSELLKPKLKWSDIDLENARITLPVRKREKSSVLPLSEGMVKTLQNLKENPMEKTRAIQPDDYLHPFPFTPDYISHLFKREVFIPAGVPDVTVHDLRRSFASYLISIGCSTADVSMLMGHSSVNVTESHYITQLASRKVEMIQKLENTLVEINSENDQQSESNNSVETQVTATFLRQRF